MLLAKQIDATQVDSLDRTKPLILITGSFDLLHAGHMRLFSQAREAVDEEATIFVVILDDANIKERKGDERPLQNLEERLLAVKTLRSVDVVMPWVSHWTGLRNFVKELKPEYLVGVEGDSGLENKATLIHDAGGTFILLKRDPRYSTTLLLKQIRSLSDESL